MSNEVQLNKIMKTLENHEKRIKDLENPSRGKAQKNISSKKSILDQIVLLKTEGFFDTPKLVKEITNKLAENGYHYPESSLTHPLQRAIRQSVLGRVKKNKIWAYCKR